MKLNRTVIIALLIAAGGVATIAFGNLGDNLVYYWTPSETLKKQPNPSTTVRLGGVVKKGSVKWDPQALKLEFAVADDASDAGPSVRVNSKDAPPQMFREGIGVVVEGVLDKSGVFQSDRVLVNHSNEYRPPQAGEATANYGTKSMGKE